MRIGFKGLLATSITVLSMTANGQAPDVGTAAEVEALEMGFGYCDEVHADMTDEAGARNVDFFTGPNTAFGVLAFNAAHNYEHYGNLVTYMRLNGIVPPSSAGQ